MAKLNVIPCPQNIKYLDGSINLRDLNPLEIQISIDEELKNEEYYIVLKNDEKCFKAGSEKGAFYLRQTLLQLKNQGQIPCVEIHDYPEFSYRGFMLDSARHMTKLDDIKKLIDAAALVKMNYMHWHLTDDQGFRLELESHPEITEIGSKRASSDFGKYHFNEEYSGYYTKNEIREIINYAAERFIEVVPEFDLPGHNLALLASHPELSCRGEALSVGTKQGIYDDILCAGNDDSLKVAFDILEEMCELFPCKYFHLGGDEAPKKRWKECPKCQERIKAEGLKNEEELQGWIVNKAIDFLREHNKQAIVWNESINSSMMPDDCIAQRWMDKKNRCAKYANSGKGVIVSDFFFFYCDYPYGQTPLKKTYNHSPYFKGLDENGKSNIAGVEAPIWTEYIRDFDKLSYMCFPRFTAVAEIGWTSEKNKNLKSFMDRFNAIKNLYDEIGIKPADANEWNPNLIESFMQVRRFRKGTFNLNSALNSLETTK